MPQGAKKEVDGARKEENGDELDHQERKDIVERIIVSCSEAPCVYVLLFRTVIREKFFYDYSHFSAAVCLEQNKKDDRFNN